MNQLGAIYALIKLLPSTAAGRAETAAETAEAAATVAQTHNYGISVSGTTLIITPPTE